MLATVSGCQKWDLSQPMSLGDPRVVRVSRPVATKVFRNSLLFIVEKAEDSGGSAEACSAQLADGAESVMSMSPGTARILHL